MPYQIWPFEDLSMPLKTYQTDKQGGWSKPVGSCCSLTSQLWQKLSPSLTSLTTKWLTDPRSTKWDPCSMLSTSSSAFQCSKGWTKIQAHLGLWAKWQLMPWERLCLWLSFWTPGVSLLVQLLTFHGLLHRTNAYSLGHRGWGLRPTSRGWRPPTTGLHLVWPRNLMGIPDFLKEPLNIPSCRHSFVTQNRVTWLQFLKQLQ